MGKLDVITPTTKGRRISRSLFLDKGICKKCINKYRKEEESCFMSEEFVRNRWGEPDESNWKLGYIFCSRDNKIGVKIGAVKEVPPEWCKYSLEQIMKGDKSHVK